MNKDPISWFTIIPILSRVKIIILDTKPKQSFFSLLSCHCESKMPVPSLADYEAHHDPLITLITLPKKLTILNPNMEVWFRYCNFPFLKRDHLQVPAVSFWESKNLPKTRHKTATSLVAPLFPHHPHAPGGMQRGWEKTMVSFQWRKRDR